MAAEALVPAAAPASTGSAAAPAKSFAEQLVTDAFNPGVRPQSFDALNYVFVALILTAVVAIALNKGSLHLIGMLVLVLVLALLMNKYRQDFLDASEAYEAAKRKKQEEEAARAAAEASSSSDSDSDSSSDSDDSDDDDEEEEDDKSNKAAAAAAEGGKPVRRAVPA